MKTYIGMKIVQAEPCMKEERSQDGSEAAVLDGYTVVYPDGYRSWSPKDVFEEAYVEVQPEEAADLLRTARAAIYDEAPSASDMAMSVRHNAMKFALDHSQFTESSDITDTIVVARQIEKFLTGDLGVGSDDLAFLKLQLELAADVLKHDDHKRALAIVEWLGA